MKNSKQELFKLTHYVISDLQKTIKKHLNTVPKPKGIDEISGYVASGWISKNQCKKIVSWWNGGQVDREQRDKKEIYGQPLIQYCINKVKEVNRIRQHSNDVRTSTGMDAKTHKQKDKDIDRLNTNATKPSEPDKPKKVTYYEGNEGKSLLDDELLKFASLVAYGEEIEETRRSDVFTSFLVDLKPKGGGPKTQVMVNGHNQAEIVQMVRRMYPKHRFVRAIRV